MDLGLATAEEAHPHGWAFFVDGDDRLDVVLLAQPQLTGEDNMVIDIVVALVVASALGLIAFSGWVTYRMARVRDYGALIVECRDPDHKSCYIIRSRVEGSHDFKLEGNLFTVLEAFDIAIRKGIVKQELA